MKNQFESANKYYNHFVTSEVYYNFQNSFLITDGIFEIAGEEECFWFLKIIFFLYFLKNDEFYLNL